jgi:hypothetical protein
MIAAVSPREANQQVSPGTARIPLKPTVTRSARLLTTTVLSNSQRSGAEELIVSTFSARCSRMPLDRSPAQTPEFQSGPPFAYEDYPIVGSRQRAGTGECMDGGANGDELARANSHYRCQPRENSDSLPSRSSAAEIRDAGIGDATEFFPVPNVHQRSC